MSSTMFPYLSGRPLGYYADIQNVPANAFFGKQYVDRSIPAGLDYVNSLARIIRPAPEVILGKQLSQQAKKKVLDFAKSPAPQKAPKGAKGEKKAGAGSLFSGFSLYSLALMGRTGTVTIETADGEVDVFIPFIGCGRGPGQFGGAIRKPEPN